MIELYDAVIMGIVEGLTEFLPISSTGHLILSGQLLDFTGEIASTFEVFIQLGAILAVVVLYWQRFKMLFKRDDPEKPFSGRRGWILLAITSLPAAVIGLLTHKLIKTYLFNSYTVLVALALGGIILMLFERWLKPPKIQSLDQLTWRQTLIIGCCQTLAMWPGVSRSGATIVGGMCVGLDRKTAAEYSFIAAVPIMMLATGYDLLKVVGHLQVQDVWMFAVGFLVAFASAMVAIHLFIHWVQKLDFKWFGLYRLAIALAWWWIVGPSL